MPVRSPLVLCTTLIGFAVLVFARRAGPGFPTALAMLVVVAWASVAIARTVARRRQSPARRRRRNASVRVAMDER